MLSACQFESPATSTTIADTEIVITGEGIVSNRLTVTNAHVGILVANIKPENHTHGDIAWISCDTNVFIISFNGEYSARSNGTVSVTARLVVFLIIFLSQ